MAELFEDLNPPYRLLMGPGPVSADPRVLRAMSMPLLGQFDPAFTRYMREVMVLLRQLFQTENRWAFPIDGTARAGIEAILVSTIEPGDRVLVPSFGRFGQLLAEIAARCGADLRIIETAWGTVFPLERIEAAIAEFRPKLVALVHGDTSTTMAQPLEGIGLACRQHDAYLYVDATATLGGMDAPVDRWQIDALSAGLQKCLSGPPGSSPVTFNDRIAALVDRRKHLERGIAPKEFVPGDGPVIRSNYFDLAMLMEYWGPERLNHHTEATSMLYAARECVRIILKEGLTECFARHRLVSDALCAGLEALGLGLYGDQRHKMPNVTGVLIPDGVDGERVRQTMLADFGIEIGTSFGPLRGRIWRIGTMGYNARREPVLLCLVALEAALRQQGFRVSTGRASDTAAEIFRRAQRDVLTEL